MGHTSINVRVHTTSQESQQKFRNSKPLIRRK